MSLKKMIGTIAVFLFMLPAAAPAFKVCYEKNAPPPGTRMFDLIWLNSEKFRFQPREIPFKTEMYLRDEEIKRRSEENQRHFDKTAVLKRVKVLKPLFDAREKYSAEIGEFQDKRPNLVLPFLQGEREGVGQRPPSSNGRNMDEHSGKEGPGSRSATNERYIIGYRLAGLSDTLPRDWYIGFGFKSNQSGGSPGERGRMNLNKGEMPPTRPDQPVSPGTQGQPQRQDFHGPIIGLAGKF